MAKPGAKVVQLLVLLTLCIFFLVVSFLPRVRFADPYPTETLKRPYPCYYDQIYSGSSYNDVLFFGASRTFSAIDADIVEFVSSEVTGNKIDAFVFAPPWSNPELQYAFFRDYLEHNPSPKVAFFELTPNAAPRPPVTYIHPLFPVLAPPDLYLDVVRSWDFVESRVFALSHALRLLVRHIDLSMRNILVSKYKYIVHPDEDCKALQASKDSSYRDTLERSNSGDFDYSTVMEAFVQDLPVVEGQEDSDLYSILTQKYSKRRGILSRIENFGPDWSLNDKEEFWNAGYKRSMSLDYYRRIVSLAREKNVTLRFFVLPSIYSPEPVKEEVSLLAGQIGSAIIFPPPWLRELSYPHYRDMYHVVREFKPVYSTWFASQATDAMKD